MNVGEVRTFNYTGGMQSINLTDKGLYKLEVWGAQGGNTRQSSTDAFKQGGKGGHSVGYIVVENPITLYACVGEHPADNTGGGYDRPKSYNGGGSGYGTDGNAASSGGGATHIATVSGELKSIGYTQFVTNRKGLIVAGGGGGSQRYLNGFGGGGLNAPNSNNADSDARGGTQTNGYTFGEGQSSSAGRISPGGGGGLYGGTISSTAGGVGFDGCGGSGYIGGVPAVVFKGLTYSPSTESNVNDGNAKATISYVAKSSLEIYLGETPLDEQMLGTNEITEVYLGSTPII